MTTALRSIPFGKPLIGAQEKRAVMDVLEGPTLVHGPRAKEFEGSFARFTGAPHAVSVSSCTAALHLSYFYLGLKTGDEVIVPAQTHVATAHAVELCGAKPVFVDAEKRTGNIDIDHIESFITPRTRAISIVHFLGMPVDMSRVMTIAKKHDLFVVEDCALAIGAYFNNVHAGLHGDVGCFSFYPVKHMTTAEGGMLITKREEIAVRIARQKAFGVDRHVGERAVPGVYDVTMLGFNYRLNEIQAALGIEQLKKVAGFIERRRQNFQILSKGIAQMDGISQLESSGAGMQSSYYCFSMLLAPSLAAKRFEMVALLKQRGVGTSVYYPHPVPHLSYYKAKYGYRDGSYPNASWISNSSISLPVGPHLDAEDMEYMVGCVKNVINEVK